MAMENIESLKMAKEYSKAINERLENSMGIFKNRKLSKKYPLVEEFISNLNKKIDLEVLNAQKNSKPTFENLHNVV